MFTIHSFTFFTLKSSVQYTKSRSRFPVTPILVSGIQRPHIGATAAVKQQYLNATPS